MPQLGESGPTVDDGLVAAAVSTAVEGLLRDIWGGHDFHGCCAVSGSWLKGAALTLGNVGSMCFLAAATG
mgnify:CR=1 FL=1